MLICRLFSVFNQIRRKLFEKSRGTLDVFIPAKFDDRRRYAYLSYNKTEVQC